MTITGPDARSAAPGQAVVDAAMLVLERMALTPADLLAAPAARPAAPTFAEYIPVVSALVSDGCRRAYGSYWNRVTEQWGGRRIDEPTPSEIRQLVQHVRATVVPRRNSRGGRSAAEHLIAALRCMYKHAEEDGLIDPADNPARKVEKPRRLPSTRRAVADKRLAEINHAAAATGDDPELDTLLLRLHTETACRRGGALALHPQDLDPEQCLILLREKGETVRWQPVSPTLMAALLGHAEERHAPTDGQLLRYRNGRGITHRPYDHLWERLGRYLPWVRAQQISMHWIRHITQTGRSRPTLRGGPDPAAIAGPASVPPSGLPGADPASADWMGWAWSPWAPISQARRSAAGTGLYRVRSSCHAELVYVGQGTIAPRLRAHAAKALRAGHRQGLYFPGAAEASWVALPGLAAVSLLEHENDLIAAHVLATGHAPAAQFLG